MAHANLGLASWATFSRPFGTKSLNPEFYAHSQAPGVRLSNTHLDKRISAAEAVPFVQSSFAAGRERNGCDEKVWGRHRSPLKPNEGLNGPPKALVAGEENGFSHTLKPCRVRRIFGTAKQAPETVSVDEKIAPSAAKAAFTTKQLWTP